MKIVSIKWLPRLFIILSFQLLDSLSTGEDLNYKNYLTNLIQNTINQEDQSRLASMIEPLRAKYAPNNFDDCYEPSYRNQTMNLFNGNFSVEKIVENYYIEEKERVLKLSSTSWKQKVQTLLETVETIIKEVEKCLPSPADKRTKVGFTSLCDWTDAEFQSLLGFELPGNSFQNDTIQPEDEPDEHCPIPDAFDWRNLGYVGRVKHQKNCSSCFIFAAVSNVETAYMIQKRTPYDICQIDLSEQAILDCMKNPNTCDDGGFPDYAWEKMKYNGIFDSEKYPYSGHQHQFHCHRAPPNPWGITIHKYFFISHMITERRLQRLVLQHGAVVVGIKAPPDLKILRGPDNWDCDSSHYVELDHSVTVVGWNKKYWIIKNSWGIHWGEYGYYYLRRGGNPRGILQEHGYAFLA